MSWGKLFSAFCSIILYQVASSSSKFCVGENVDSCNGELKPGVYGKVHSPTFNSLHLTDLPGFTRSVVEKDHALLSPESRVYAPIPYWVNSSAAFLITPAMGAHFTLFFVNMGANSESALPSGGAERFVFVLEGEISVNILSTTLIENNLKTNDYVFFQPNSKHGFTSSAGASLIVIERMHAWHENGADPKFAFGNIDSQPVIPVEGEVFTLRKLLPTTSQYDFNIHVMDFLPGEYLNVKEVHYNQHGLVLLEGKGIYRLGDKWYPVQAGDAIWMAPFVPQWYAALGRERTRYFLYKDTNRDPLMNH